MGQIYPGTSFEILHVWFNMEMTNLSSLKPRSPLIPLHLEFQEQPPAHGKTLIFSFSSSAIQTCDSASTIVACFKQEKNIFSFPSEVFTTCTSTFGLKRITSEDQITREPSIMPTTKNIPKPIVLFEE